jgi:hypothetical protein
VFESAAMTIALPLLAAATTLLGASLAAAAPADPLARHRWSDRLLVLSAPRADDGRLAAQRRIVEAARSGARERDLVVVEAVGGGGEAAAIRARLGLPPGSFRAVLVGKDGGAKLTSPEPIAAETLFETIDAMPMRRQEARTGPAR